MRDVGAAQRAAGRSRSRLLRLLAVVLAVALGGQPVPAPRLETVSTQHPTPPAHVRGSDRHSRTRQAAGLRGTGAAPTGVNAARGDGRFTLSWAANGADHDADGHRVLRDGVVVNGRLARVGHHRLDRHRADQRRSYDHALTASDVNRLRDLYAKDLRTGAGGVGLG
jgi:hypothetical protein